MELLAKEQRRGEALRIGGVTEIDLSASLMFESRQALKNWPYPTLPGRLAKRRSLGVADPKPRIALNFSAWPLRQSKFG